jgi:hypothetical protein
MVIMRVRYGKIQDYHTVVEYLLKKKQDLYMRVGDIKTRGMDTGA